MRFAFVVRGGLIGGVMTEETATPPTSASAPAGRALWWTLAAVALVALSLAGWHYGIELPAERRAAVDLAKQRAANALTIPDLKLDLVWIASGTFRMGSPAQNTSARWFYEIRQKLTGKPNPGYTIPDNSPRLVTLTKLFWLGRTEVTQAQWTAVMGGVPSYFKGDELPVESVSWGDAMEFCQKLTERERAVGRLPAGYAFTLPTEAQWEYACRAGTTGDYAGDLDAMAWYELNSSRSTHPVGTKQVNAWGLSDMHGNVSEWCLDWYGRTKAGGSMTNPAGPVLGEDRTVRGGSWTQGAALVRSAVRSRASQDGRMRHVGLRVALVPVK